MKTEEDESAEVEDGDKQDSGEKEMEEEEDEVPSLPLGVTGTLCSLFHACGKSQGLTLFFQSKLQFPNELCKSGV